MREWDKFTGGIPQGGGGWIRPRGVVFSLRHPVDCVNSSQILNYAIRNNLLCFSRQNRYFYLFATTKNAHTPLGITVDDVKRAL